jgi:short subunit dehydrogenase-like uncharacterized protein
MARSRVHDIVLYGATGFTGGLVAEYLARHASLDRTPWAIAGRSREKLHALRARLARIRPGCEALPIVIASSEDRASLAALAKNARCVVSTVGPFAHHGEPLFAACAEHGTDYVDSTGEPSFVRAMLERHGARALERGALMVSCCGVDSVPTDLGAYYTMRELRPTGPVELEGFFEFRMRTSGGTLQSILAVLEERGALRATPQLPEVQPGRRVSPARARLHRDAELGWVVPLPSVDPEIALRSAAELPLYGPDFRYAHYLVARNLGRLAGLGLGAAGLFVAAQTRPTRALVGRLVEPGTGPSPEQRQQNWFRVRFRARQPDSSAPLLVTEVSGGDPGYEETARMLGECALSMVNDRDRLPSQAGVRTPACAFGDILLDRLVKAGLSFRVVSR